MSSFLCFLCHNTVDSDTPEDVQEKYREIVGMHPCPDSQLCHVCCHMLNKLWLFKTVCLKRSLEYPVLFREKGTINLQRTDIDTHTLCYEDACSQQNNKQSKYYLHSNDYEDCSTESNEYVKLEEDNDLSQEKDLHNLVNGCNNDNGPSNDDNIPSNDDNRSSIDDNRSSNDDNRPSNDDNGFSNDDKRSSDDDKRSSDDDSSNDNEDACNDDGLDVNERDSNYMDDFENDKTDAHILNGGEETHEEIAEENTKSPESKKTKKSKKKLFKKIILSLEDQKFDLEAQRRSQKYLDAEFKCHNCAMSFLFKDTYQTHMMRHEESNGEYRCGVCTLRFASVAVLRSHVASHSERYRCTVCGVSVRVRQRQTHARACHGTIVESVACHLCGNVFRDANGCQQHLKRFHQSKSSSRTYPCSVCGKTYHNQAAVRTHMIKHIHRKFSCDQCDSTFSSPYTLNQHKAKHAVPGSSPVQYYCETCGLGYSSRKSLLAHRRNALNHQQRSFECPVCTRVCPNQRALASHVATVHSATKDFACPSCPARYSNRKSLVRHMGGHRQKYVPKMAICHLCGGHFKGKNKLNRHLREVCEKDKLEAELSMYYDQDQNII